MGDCDAGASLVPLSLPPVGECRGPLAPALCRPHVGAMPVAARAQPWATTRLVELALHDTHLVMGTPEGQAARGRGPATTSDTGAR